jgi:hypothetical protein
MWRLLKFIVGLALILGLGLFYGRFKETNEDIMYALVSYQYPNSVSSITMIKKLPESTCEKRREALYSETISGCKGCRVLINECRRQLTADYATMFKKEKGNFPYMYSPFKYPQVTIAGGLTEGAFSKLCEFGRKQHKDTICVN